MFDFLRAIGLRPLEWGQSVDLTGKGSPYIGEVLDAAFAEVRAVIVLLTGDDVAVLRNEFRTADDPAYETKPTPQARPNVIFEAGMAFGTHPDRTVIVEIGNLRPFSDVVGRNTVRLTNSTQSRQILAECLKNAGCSVDLSGTDWHTVGDFDPAAGPGRPAGFVVLPEEVDPEVSKREKQDIKTPDIIANEVYNDVLLLLATKGGRDIPQIRRHLQRKLCLSQIRAGVLAKTSIDFLSKKQYVWFKKGYITALRGQPFSQPKYIGENDAYHITDKGGEYLVERSLV